MTWLSLSFAISFARTFGYTNSQPTRSPEKYQVRTWRLDDPDSIAPLIARLNEIRRGNPALQHLRTLRFHDADAPGILCYSKTDPLGQGDPILCVVNTDARNRQAGNVHVDPRNSRATFVGDLCTAATIPSEIFDCAIIVQTLQFLSDPLAGLKTLHRILRPSGILLMTVPGITVLSPESDQWSEMWLSSFTPSTIRALTEQSFTPELCAVEVHGNILAAVCALEGIAVEDVTTGELDAHDATYPVVITVRATKQF